MSPCDNCGCRGWRVFYRNKDGEPLVYACNKCGMVVKDHQLSWRWTKEDAESLLALVKAKQNATD